jgi:hypothetical protein
MGVCAVERPSDRSALISRSIQAKKDLGGIDRMIDLDPPDVGPFFEPPADGVRILPRRIE